MISGLTFGVLLATTSRTDLTALAQNMPVKSSPVPFVATRTALKPNGTTVFSVNDDIFRYDQPRTATTPRNDDYTALKRAFTFFTGKKFPTRTTLIIPGTLSIDRLYIQPGSKNDDLTKFPTSVRGTDAFIKDSENFQIVGDNARIILKGDFYRPADYFIGRSRDDSADCYKSGTRQLSAFLFANCSNFSVSGIEVDGNVDKMTKEHTAAVHVIEGGSAGIRTSGCTNYTFSNLYFHHLATDGIKLGSGFADRLFDKSGKLLREITDNTALIDNVICSNNGRQGLTVGCAANVTIQDSWFTMIGYTEGLYSNHAPAAGIDVEPAAGSNDLVTFYTRVIDGKKQVSRTLTTTKLDDGANVRHTRNIVVQNCVFWRNFGNQFMATPGTETVNGVRNVYTSSILFRNNDVIEEDRPKSRGAFSMVTDNSTIVHNRFDASGDVFLGGRSVLFSGNSIVTRGSGFQCKWPDSSVSITNNTVSRTIPMEPMESLPIVSQNCVSLSGNVFKLPSYTPAYYINDMGINTLTPIIQVSNCSDVTNNIWTMPNPNPANKPRVVFRKSNSRLGNILKFNQVPSGCQIDNLQQ
jgi:hypothetical protein